MAEIGDLAYLGSYLTNTHVYGVVTDGATPDQFTATFDIVGDQGTLITNAIVGPRGAAGQHAFALRLQVSSIDDPDDLPNTLTNTTADIGKYWMIDDVDGEGNIIGSSAYIWFGTAYRRMMMGSPGPVGPTPRITPSVELISPELSSEVILGGTYQDPTMDFKLAVPEGPAGPASKLQLCPDVQSPATTAGQVLTWDGTMDGSDQVYKWMDLSGFIPLPYSVPENAFSSYSGLSTRATIGSFAVPPQTFAWKPIVWGHIKAFGLELDPDPLTIGCEVRLGDPVTGTLVARGFGNSTGWVTMVPHYSTPGAPTVAVTPDNTVSQVAANHSTPALGTLYVNLYNDGAAGVYVFNPADAQLFVLLVPA